jgi:hypothetical protein
MRTVLVVEASKLLRVEREHTLKKAGYLVVGKERGKADARWSSGIPGKESIADEF